MTIVSDVDEIELFQDEDFFLSNGTGPELLETEGNNGMRSTPSRGYVSSQSEFLRNGRYDDGSEDDEYWYSPNGTSSRSERKVLRDPDKSTVNKSTRTHCTDDGYIALGVIKVYSQEDKTYIRGSQQDDIYPNTLISMGVKKHWVKLDGLTIGTKDGISHVRCYILPEDVDRSHRGSTKDFRKVVRYLLDFVDRSHKAWCGHADVSGTHERYEAAINPDEESLFYIFNTLESPRFDLSSFGGDSYSYQALTDTIEDKILGLQTSLYAYQKRSVAAMISKESDPVKLHDPRKTRFEDINGKSFYMDVHQGSLVSNLAFYTEPQGGILAETMGYGKTLICLALILATRGHYPQVPQDRIDLIQVESREKTGSLLSMAARRLKHEGIPWKNEFHAFTKAGYHYDRIIRELKQYERAYAEPIFTPTTPIRRGKRDANALIHLCSATLVIVPPNLIVQWQTEIAQHVEKDALDVLVLNLTSSDMPSWRELVKYDLILMSRARFEREYRDDELNQGRLVNGRRYVSPLTQLRWLRVICDEGHGFAGSSSKTHAMAMLDKMFIDRRWVVSGTPSSTLHGVEVGLSLHSSQVTSNPEVDRQTRKSGVASALKKRREPSVKELEAKDLERLRLIVVNFLKLQPWANSKGSADTANWKQYLAPIEIERKRYSKPALRKVLQTLIVRHRIEDIDIDLSLPPLNNRVVYLDPSYHDKLAINMFVMVLISNFVTSEREDEDYMFHPRNRKKLDQLITNLRQATFHWVGFTEENLKDTLKVSNKYLDENLDTISDADGALLTEAIINGDRALSDPGWRAFSYFHEMGLVVQDFPEHAREAWALDSQSSNPVLMGTVQAREAQKHIKTCLSKNGCEDPFVDIVSTGLLAMRHARDRAAEEQKQRDKTTTSDSHKDKQQIGIAEEPKVKGTSTASSSGKAIIASSSPIKRQQSDLIADTAAKISQATILGFTSSKLSYLISQILIYSPTEKCIIFYSNNNTAFWVAEALELFNISFLIYANTLSVQKRADYLAKFSADDETRVLLMDLKQAAQGLHVAAASRVYIITPIWDSSIESQAIKRAHRIGQVKPVYVETLVLKGTFEEVLIRRRHDKDERADSHTISDRAPAPEVSPTSPTKVNASNHLLDDEVMVEFLKSIRFMHIEDGEDRAARLPVAHPLFRVPSIEDGKEIDVGTNSSIFGPSSATAKRKQKVSPHEKRITLKRPRIAQPPTTPMV